MGILNSNCTLEVPGELDKLSTHLEEGKRQNNEVIKKIITVMTKGYNCLVVGGAAALEKDLRMFYKRAAHT